MKSQRFTIDGSAALEQHLVNTCRRVLDGVLGIIPRSAIEGLLLGGGYGRGEGGVLRTSNGDHPYNDLEFYLFIRGWAPWEARKFGPALRQLAHELSPDAGVEIEFKILSLQKLRRSPINMFYYDLVMGHRWIFGGEPLLSGCDHHRHAETMPLCEATRLIMNRCSGLLFAREKLEEPKLTPDAADFIGRNHAKAKLAFGDALLAAEGQYHWSARARHERLLHLKNRWPWLEQVQALHGQGLEFKFQPHCAAPDLPSLSAQQKDLTELALLLWFWLENRRLEITFDSPQHYAFDGTNKCPETNLLRNYLINLAAFGLNGACRRNSLRYPRERIFNALTLLLWEPGLFSDSTLLRHIQGELNTPATTFPELVSAYRNLWSRFS